MCIISPRGQDGFAIMYSKFDFALSAAKRPFPDGFLVLFTRLICDIKLEGLGNVLSRSAKKFTFQVKVSSRWPLLSAMSLSFRSRKSGAVVSSESQIVSLISRAAIQIEVSTFFVFFFWSAKRPNLTRRCRPGSTHTVNTYCWWRTGSAQHRLVWCSGSPAHSSLHFQTVQATVNNAEMKEWKPSGDTHCNFKTFNRAGACWTFWASRNHACIFF